MQGLDELLDDGELGFVSRRIQHDGGRGQEPHSRAGMQLRPTRIDGGSRPVNRAAGSAEGSSDYSSGRSPDDYDGGHQVPSLSVRRIREVCRGTWRRQAHVRQRRSVHARHASRGGAVSRAWPHAAEGVATSLREGSRRDRAHCRFVGGARLRPAWHCVGVPLPRRARAGRTADGLLCAARRQPRRLLPASALQPSARLDGRCAARVLELCLARQAQRRPPHLHEHRRLRRRRHAGAAGALRAVAGTSAVVPLPAPLHLADVHAHGAALADRRRPRRVCAWQRRRKHAASAAGLESCRRDRRQGASS